MHQTIVSVIPINDIYIKKAFYLHRYLFELKIRRNLSKQKKHCAKMLL